MSAAKDENAQLQGGTLPCDPVMGTAPIVVRIDVRDAAVKHAKQSGVSRLDVSDVHAESALLSALLWCGANAPTLINPAMVRDIVDRAEMFSSPAHRMIFEAILALDARVVPPDPAAVHSELLRNRTDLAAGGIEYLDQLVAAATTSSEPRVREYAASVRDTWVRRGVVDGCRKLATKACDTRMPTAELATQASELATTITRNAAVDTGVVRVNAVASAVIRDLMTKELDSWRTGFAGFDALTGGLFPKEHSILAARTSDGKSALASQVAFGVVKFNPKVAALYASLEMPAKNLFRRVVSGHARVDHRKLRRKTLTPAEFERVVASSTELALEHVYFMDSSIQSIADIKGRAEWLGNKLAKEGIRLALIVIDHLHLVKPCDKRNASREEQVASISQGFMDIGNEYSCHVLGIAQLKRGVDARKGEDRFPRHADISESDRIARNANNVFLLHRERDAKGIPIKGAPATLIGAKTRDDELFEHQMDLEGRFMQFSERMGAANARGDRDDE